MKKQYSKGNDHKAIESKKPKLIFSRRIDDRGKGNIEADAAICAYEDLGWAYADLGRSYVQIGESPKASEYLEKGLDIIQDFADTYKEDSVLGYPQNVQNPLFGVSTAIENYEKNLVNVRENGDLHGEGNALYKIGKSYEDAGEILKAIGFYEQALVIHRRICNRPDIDAAHGKSGSMDTGPGDDCSEIKDKASRLAKVCNIQIQNAESASLSKFYRAYEGLCWAYVDLGMCHFFLDADHSAVEYLEKALVVIQELEDKRGEASIFSNLGEVYADLGEIYKSIEYHEKALVISHEIRNPHGEVFSLDKLGNACFELGKISKAIEYFKRCLELAREISDREIEVESLDKLGLAYFDISEAQTAIGFYEQALVLHRGIGDRHYKDIAPGNPGNADPELYEAGCEIGFYNQALIIVRTIHDWRSEGKILSMLGTAFADLGEACKAIELFEQALVIQRKIRDQYYEGISLGNLGFTRYQIGEKEKGIVGMKQALTIFEATDSPYISWARKHLKAWGVSISE